MTNSSSQSSCVINGNSVDSIGLSDDTYFYNFCLRVGTDCIVSNNYFSGIAPDGITMAIITAGSSIITNNIFSRGVNAISYYLENGSPNDQIITDNIFDQPTTDGVNSNLIAGLTTTSTYLRNKNQTVFITVPINEFAISNNFGVGSSLSTYFSQPTPAPGSVTFTVQNAGLCITVDANGGGITEKIYCYGMLDKYIPDGSQIIYAAQGYSTLSDASQLNTASLNTITLNINQEVTSNVNFNTAPTYPFFNFSSGVLDIGGAGGPNITSNYHQGFSITTGATSYSASASLNNVRLSEWGQSKTTPTFYNYLNLSSATPPLTKNLLNPTSATITINISTVGAYQILASPIILQCRW